MGADWRSSCRVWTRYPLPRRPRRPARGSVRSVACASRSIGSSCAPGRASEGGGTMWWTMPDAGTQPADRPATRHLAVMGTMQRRQRTVLTLVRISDVQPNRDQPRKHFDEEKLAELAASIEAHGLLQPIVV